MHEHDVAQHAHPLRLRRFRTKETELHFHQRIAKLRNQPPPRGRAPEPAKAIRYAKKVHAYRIIASIIGKRGVYRVASIAATQ
ncbi:hypothetical protein [Burkholderia lata]|uniref:hypothetical protein n=1 Tax=Burkholderia lata (strain ATCC 17760 / DSM 23089 / LMG 22485 / NCIMB 9086 / R18194 / 383) TaxID=482957 RepID=UPI0018D4766B|nr:hypothetical protein [Burkholderia lata]